MTAPLGNPVVLDKIRAALRERRVPFREAHHGPTRTSEEAAIARGEELRIGGKALLMSCDGEFRLFVLPADQKVDSGAIRRTLGIKKLRFATPEELMAMTGLVPGSVPPFGEPILPYPVCVDEAIRDNERIAFNAGMLTDSIIMSVTDYVDLARPAATFVFSSSG